MNKGKFLSQQVVKVSSKLLGKVTTFHLPQICFFDLTGGVMAALLKAPRMKRRQAARVTEN